MTSATELPPELHITFFTFLYVNPGTDFLCQLNQNHIALLFKQINPKVTRRVQVWVYISFCIIPLWDLFSPPLSAPPL